MKKIEVFFTDHAFNILLVILGLIFLLRKQIQFMIKDPLVDFNRDETKSELQKLIYTALKEHSFGVVSIESMFMIGLGDYDESRLSKFKELINRQSVDDEYSWELSWNKSHLHLILVSTNNYEKYVAAIVYPYDYLESAQVVWIIQLTDIQNVGFLAKLMSNKIFPVDVKLNTG